MKVRTLFITSLRMFSRFIFFGVASILMLSCSKEIMRHNYKLQNKGNTLYFNVYSSLNECEYSGVRNHDWSTDLSEYEKANKKKAFPGWLLQAEQGDAKKQFFVAKMFYFGEGVVPDLNKAIFWYSESSNQNYPPAQNNLAILYESYEGVEGNYFIAFNLLCRSALSGLHFAQNNLGDLYVNGKGVAQDYKEAGKWYRLAAEQGHAPAQYNLGFMYYEGQGVVQDYEESFKWFRKSAEQGHSRAQNNLAVMYVKGKGVVQDYKEAVKWYRKSAEQGYSGAQYNLGLMYVKGQGAPQDYKEAVKWFRLAADQGHILSMNYLGFTYYALLHDLDKAVMWYKKAKQLGSLMAQNSLGEIYARRELRFKKKNPYYDPERALSYLEKGIEARYVDAYSLLALGYRLGGFVKKDPQKAIKLLLEASYLVGIGTRDSESFLIKAFECALEDNLLHQVPQKKIINILKIRAENGSYEHQRLLGKTYLNPNFFNSNNEQGMYWLNISAEDSIQSNVDLAYLKVSNVTDESNYLEKAIFLYEKKLAKDYEMVHKFNPDLIIKVYHWLADNYLTMNRFFQAEQLLRQSEVLFLKHQSLHYEMKQQLLFSRLSRGLGETDQAKEILEKVIAMFKQGERVNYSVFFRAVNFLGGILTEEGSYDEAILFFRQYLTYIDELSNLEGSRDNFSGVRDSINTYQRRFTLNLANLYSLQENIRMSETFLDQYLEHIGEDVSLGLIGTKANLSILRNDLSQADKLLDVAKKMIKKDNVQVDISHLIFLKRIGDFAAKKGYYNFASKWLSEGLRLYNAGVVNRIDDGALISAYEKKMIRNAISDYIYFSEKSGYHVDGLTLFKVMQLTAGLSVSSSIEKILRISNESPEIQKLHKQIDALNFEKDKLLRKKFKISFDKAEQTLAVNESLSDIDSNISRVKGELKFLRKSVTFKEDYLQSVEKVRESLDKGDAFLTFIVSDNRTQAWLVTNDGVFRHDSSLRLKDVKGHVDLLKEALNPNQGLRSDFPFESSRVLYDILVNPFIDQLEAIDRLIVAPDPVLSSIPFSILASVDDKSMAEGTELIDTTSSLRGIVGVKSLSDSKSDTKAFAQANWLIEQFSIAVVPSVFSLVKYHEFQNIREASQLSFVGIGNPVLNGKKYKKTFSKEEVISSVTQRGFSSDSLSSLPETEVELAFIGKHFSHSSIVTGLDATEEKIRNMDLRQYNVISFATHALVSNELTGLVEPSLVLTPVDAEVLSNDGLLTASEIMKLDLNADMVLLSACNTASSYGVSNSEGLSGLANSFFQAGAKSLFVSYWSVISESAVDITTRMFSSTNTGRSYAHRHRNSVLELLKESEGTIKSHPSYWAPFSVIGVN